MPVDRRSVWAARASRVLAPAIDSFRMYRGTALLLVTTASFTMGAVLPIAGLIGTGVTRLALSTEVPADLGLRWTEVPESPAATRQGMVDYFFHLLLTAGIAILVIAMLSLFTLFIARALAREGEITVRRAVGASHRSLLASAVLEGLGLFTIAAVAGGALGLVVSRRMGASWPGVILPGSTGPVLTGMGLAGAVLMGGALFPVVFARRAQLHDTEMKPLSLFGPALLQLGLSLIAITTGALLAQRAEGAARAARAEASAGRVFQVDTGLSNPARRAAAYATLLGDLSHHPELGAVSLASPGLIVGLGTVAHVVTDCGDCSMAGIPSRWMILRAVHQFVSPDTFRALHWRLTEGRWFGERDRIGTEPVVVVNRTLARHYFQYGEALGRRMKVGLNTDEWYTVVGVVEDAPRTGFGGTQQPAPTAYLSVLQQPIREVELLIPAGEEPARAAMVSRLLHSRFSSGTIVAVSEADLIAAEAAPVEWFGQWIGKAGWAMFVLGALGLFALLRLWVTSFHSEYGLRRAVGARRQDILLLILSQAVKVGFGGIALGLWFGPSVWLTLAEMLPGLPAWEARLVARIAAVLMGVVLAAVSGPAWAATHRTPLALIGATGE